LELVLVTGVLVVATAAAGEVWARRLGAVRRRLNDCVDVRAGKTRLLLSEGGLDFFSVEDKGDEDGLAAWTGFVGDSGGAGSGGQTGQAVAAVDQLFNCEEQELILRHVERSRRRPI